ncbi:hypothetical protein [Pseudomonas aeruginosa]|uniref:hypothetical protein n=1 Tax=Pseudomonas aeruginosa TaxID=287 RepID=UPI000FF472D7|nr:hypothetical protein [Pseudomonas aeruginosa]MDI3620939.1 hypothetical protein [Pseudomonas aeruginosa]QGQ04549.1 hypothetical protein FDK04_18880 [Pseudomonas aeruginosa]RPQ01203.1 hypothetical protein IPC1124_10920 [Pseudomonas aeruginosa]RPQ14059.1 hypothetical protein IPC1112_05225 [Pseudomonas aeruginosa]HEJ3570233.1 hypothetical protein [Pseudomonas aeruginosa]
MQTVMIFGAACGTVSDAAHRFRVAQPSHSDDFRNTPEPNGLDTDSYSLTFFDDDLMAFR